MMKNVLLLLLILYAVSGVKAQNYDAKLKEHRDGRNLEMTDTAASPLKPEERLKFRELNFFPADSAYCLNADFIKSKRKEIITMPTSSGKQKTYYKIGIAVFELQQKRCTLSVFQPVQLKDHLFIPFTDLTSGDETYGGGRYIEAVFTGKKSIRIDFNYCYNPYCAYTSGYSCPIPPKENFIDLHIRAGEKLLWNDH